MSQTQPRQPRPRTQGAPSVVEASIAQLDDIFARERAAVVALDVDALASLAEEKQALMTDLTALAATLPGGKGAEGTEAPRIDAATRAGDASVRAAATRVIAQAEANVALLSDAIATIAEVLGLSVKPATYDARARLVPSVRAIAGKNV